MKPAAAEPIGAYAAATPTDFAAYDAAGNTWPVPQADAAALEAARQSRLEARQRGGGK